METLTNDQPVPIDVDETLVVFDYPATLEKFAITLERNGVEVKVVPHWKHIKQMREHFIRGHAIIVWSAGGYAWAQQVIKMLGIEKYVTYCMAKPRWFYDDRKAEFFMPEINRVYYPLETINECGEQEEHNHIGPGSGIHGFARRGDQGEDSEGSGNK